jgi:hypothetical protein
MDPLVEFSTRDRGYQGLPLYDPDLEYERRSSQYPASMACNTSRRRMGIHLTVCVHNLYTSPVHSSSMFLILHCRAVMYFLLYPVLVGCECCILFRVMGEVSVISKIILGVIAMAYSIGIFRIVGLMTLVAMADIFIVKPRHLFIRQSYRAWVPVSDGSLGF